MSANDREYADLTVIKGIGPTRQQWLREALHVYTLQDLAALTPDAIETQLKAEGRTAARSEIEAWIAQAQKLTTVATPPPALPAASTVVATTPKATASADKVSDWRAFAQFGVEFLERSVPDAGTPAREYQTAVRYIETGRSATWPGLESQRLCAWMLEQIGEQVPQGVAEAPAVAPAPLLKTPIKVSLTQVRVFQPPEAATPTAIGQAAQPMQGVIKSVEPFALEVAFELAEPVAGDIAAQIPYHAQYHVRHQITGASLHLGNTESSTLVVGQTAYITRLPSTTLLAGLYRVQVLVSLQSRPPSLAYFEIPLLQVV